MNDLSTPYVEVDGRPVAADPLFLALLGGYGHMTAMEIRNGRIRGLDLHLARLDAATRELFGEGLDGGLVRERVRGALRTAGVTDAAVRVYVHLPPGEGAVRPVVTVIARPPTPEPAGPQRLTAVPYQRPAAHLKHAGVFGQVYHLRRAWAAGFDEALLVGQDGTVAEGAITNIGFVEGDTVVWPDAPALDGITMLLLRRELDRLGLPWLRRPVRLDDLPSFDGAFVTNSLGIAPVGRIDELSLPADLPVVERLRSLYADARWDAV
ncbi:aminotransferase class IV [Streptomyces huiliensis]|uniref:aminotransferase class IV n=1 Tax=Streptomyces huiliensis TaxID=2876027 RepID=UPI001CBE873A|nr:aminotransferase class IV [Streptomyces huiliensis]MBZ4320220.1 aminotransferase class IV [Streptomyces huiliensis]